ncbi:TPA: hypothetical protein QCI08_001949 [Enterobacter ludwigii]|nr:hypothetical protein [Enterobacter ludwigii]
MSKQNAVDLAAVAHALIAKLPRMTLAAAVAEWNSAAPHLAFIGVPGRKAHLERSLTAMIADIEAEQEAQPEQDAAATRAAFEKLDLFAQWNAIDDAHAEALEMNSKIDAINDPRTDDEGNDTREWCGNDIEAAHVEALHWNAFIDYCWPMDVEDVMVGTEIYAHEENHRFDWLANRWGLFWAATDYFTRRTMIEEAHAEALRIDAEQYAAPVTCSIFQRNDGVQLALDSSCDVRFIRTRKKGNGLRQVSATPIWKVTSLSRAMFCLPPCLHALFHIQTV